MATSAERRAAHDGSHPAAYSHPAPLVQQPPIPIWVVGL